MNYWESWKIVNMKTGSKGWVTSLMLVNREFHLPSVDMQCCITVEVKQTMTHLNCVLLLYLTNVLLQTFGMQREELTSQMSGWGRGHTSCGLISRGESCVCAHFDTIVVSVRRQFIVRWNENMTSLNGVGERERESVAVLWDVLYLSAAAGKVRETLVKVVKHVHICILGWWRCTDTSITQTGIKVIASNRHSNRHTHTHPFTREKGKTLE